MKRKHFFLWNHGNSTIRSVVLGQPEANTVTIPQHSKKKCRNTKHGPTRNGPLKPTRSKHHKISTKSPKERSRTIPKIQKMICTAAHELTKSTYADTSSHQKPAILSKHSISNEMVWILMDTDGLDWWSSPIGKAMGTRIPLEIPEVFQKNPSCCMGINMDFSKFPLEWNDNMKPLRNIPPKHPRTTFWYIWFFN